MASHGCTERLVVSSIIAEQQAREPSSTCTYAGQPYVYSGSVCRRCADERGVLPQELGPSELGIAMGRRLGLMEPGDRGLRLVQLLW